MWPTTCKCPRYGSHRNRPILIQTFADFSSNDIHSTPKCFTSVNSSISVLCTISERRPSEVLKYSTPLNIYHVYQANEMSNRKVRFSGCVLAKYLYATAL